MKLSFTLSQAREASYAFALTTVTLICTILWHALLVPTLAQSWLGQTKTLRIDQQQVTEGRILAQRSGVLQIAPINGRFVLTAEPKLFRSQENNLIWWYVQLANGNAKASIEWDSPNGTMQEPLKFSEARESQIWNANGDLRWLGEIGNLRLIVQTDNPVEVGSLMIANESVQSRLNLMWNGWFGLHQWKLSDINFIEASDRNGNHNFNLICLVSVAIASIAYAVNQLWTKRYLNPKTLALVFLTGWFWSSLRWEIDLSQKAFETWRKFGGKTLHEKHLVADDHEYYWVVETIKSQLPNPNSRSTRIFVHYTKALPYDVGKLDYYSTPSFLNFFDTPLPTGSVFGVIRSPHLFRKETQQLTLSNGTTFRAEKIAERGGAAVYRAL
jgi:hypothetical protein